MKRIRLNVILLDNKSMIFLDALVSNNLFRLGQKTSFDEGRCQSDFKRGKVCLTQI
jgi:hypothetical protein